MANRFKNFDRSDEENYHKGVFLPDDKFRICAYFLREGIWGMGRVSNILWANKRANEIAFWKVHEARLFYGMYLIKLERHVEAW